MESTATDLVALMDDTAVDAAAMDCMAVVKGGCATNLMPMEVTGLLYLIL